MDKQKLDNSEKNCDPYKAIKVSGLSNDITVTTGEPDVCNPNGYESISTILRNIGHRASIDSYSENKNESLRWSSSLMKF